MTIMEKLLSSAIVAEDQIIIDLFRRWLGDYEEFNILEGVQENTDLELYQYLLLAFQQIAYDIQPVIGISDFKDLDSFNLLFKGAMLQLLVSKGILSSRNTLNYNDAGGVNVQDYDKYGRYINWFNVVVSSFYNDVKAWKVHKNIESGYGGVNSEYGATGNGLW